MIHPVRPVVVLAFAALSLWPANVYAQYPWYYGGWSEIDVTPSSPPPPAKGMATGSDPYIHELAVQVDRLREIAAITLPEGASDPIYQKANGVMRDIVQLQLAADSGTKKLLRSRFQLLEERLRRLTKEIKQRATTVPQLRGRPARLTLALHEVRDALSLR